MLRRGTSGRAPAAAPAPFRGNGTRPVSRGTRGRGKKDEGGDEWRYLDLTTTYRMHEREAVRSLSPR